MEDFIRQLPGEAKGIIKLEANGSIQHFFAGSLQLGDMSIQQFSALGQSRCKAILLQADDLFDIVLLLDELFKIRSARIDLDHCVHSAFQELVPDAQGASMWRTDPNPVGGIHFAPNAYCYRCPLGKKYPECDLACANAVEDLIKTATSGHPAALIAEPIQGNAGIITPPKGYFKRLKEILNQYGTLLIADEVQTGFARTGKMFAIENFDVVPDIMAAGCTLKIAPIPLDCTDFIFTKCLAEQCVLICCHNKKILILKQCPQILIGLPDLALIHKMQD